MTTTTTHTPGPCAPTQANARLIAEAPAMYDFVVAVLDGCNDGGYCPCWRCNWARALLARIDGA